MRSRTWLGWILVPIGLLVVAVAGMRLYMSVSRQLLHTNQQTIPSVTHAAPTSKWSEVVERTRRIMKADLAAQNLPGLSVAVGVGGEIVWAEGFGWADIETRVPVTPDTTFRIGITSTVLTSAAVGVLLDKGKLTLDNEIQTYVPKFAKKPWPVTLRQLMANVGGVETDGEDDPLFRQRCERPDEAVQHFAQSALLFEPGTQYRHSNYGWILVSAAIEAAADQKFLKFMDERIFQPLGMDKTGAESATDENPDRVGEPEEDPPPFTFIRQVILQPLGVAGPNRINDKDPATVYFPGYGYNPHFRYGLHVMRPRNLSCYAGSMAFFSTPSDLVRFGLAVDGGKLLRPATVQVLQTSQKLTSGQETGYGLGWELNTVKLAGKPTQAAGFVGGGRFWGRKVVSLMMFREAGIVVAVMSNVSYADTPALALKVAEAFAQPAQ